MSFFQQLVSATENERNELLAIPLINDALRGAVSHDSYLAFLAEAYHHVKHTVPLLMACGARLPERLEWLREAIAHYIDEEKGHHEWILNDIRHAGGDDNAVRHGQASHATDVMVAYAYDTVMRRNPVGFFGMVLVLEGTSVALALNAAAAIKQSLGLSDKCFSYLTSHGELDKSHVGFYEELMDRLDDPDDRAAVIHCARAMYRLYGDIFRNLPHAPRKEAA
ncbi:TenA family transcriptional regulator [Sulfurivermis fontis]|uniref:TenA family transcriptional regulator n=1 Tax=Sulfurivermis fontis TaxID=1972068 RepID=UPI000FD7DA32|nr:iron-containing redox enzyme family protein [Sulfurivermis fontis]